MCLIEVFHIQVVLDVHIFGGWVLVVQHSGKLTQNIVIGCNKVHLRMSSDWSPVDLNAEVRLVKVPGKEYPKVNDIFQFVVVPPVPTDNVPKGHVIVKNLFLSVDATMRVWISGVRSYMEPVKPGDMMKGMGVG